MSNDVWVFVEQHDGRLHGTAREMIAAGQKLAAAVGGSVQAVVLGSGVSDLAQEIASSADIQAVKVGDHEELGAYTPGAFIDALLPALEADRPGYFLFPHSYQSLDFFPKLAGRLDAAVLSGVTGFEGSGDELLWTRNVMGGKLEAKVRLKGATMALISIQAGSFPEESLVPGSSQVVALELGTVTADREILGVDAAARDQVDLSQANYIVAAGRGVGGEDKLGVARDLAEVLGAELGASRPAVDAGWLPRDRQIGSSGQTVSPKLYVGLGISGAIQHVVGMKSSGCIVAINKDPGAPIFSVANYGIVGDLHEVVPALIEALKEAKQ